MIVSEGMLAITPSLDFSIRDQFEKYYTSCIAISVQLAAGKNQDDNYHGVDTRILNIKKKRA